MTAAMALAISSSMVVPVSWSRWQSLAATRNSCSVVTTAATEPSRPCMEKPS
jgi:hypothetical protein